MSYATNHARTALRTVPWYVLPPAALCVIIVTFINLFLGGLAPVEQLIGAAKFGALVGLLLWSIRQLFRALQIARNYTRAS